MEFISWSDIPHGTDSSLHPLSIIFISIKIFCKFSASFNLHCSLFSVRINSVLIILILQLNFYAFYLIYLIISWSRGIHRNQCFHWKQCNLCPFYICIKRSVWCYNMHTKGTMLGSHQYDAPFINCNLWTSFGDASLGGFCREIQCKKNQDGYNQEIKT